MTVQLRGVDSNFLCIAQFVLTTEPIQHNSFVIEMTLAERVLHCGAVYCDRSCLFVCEWVCEWVCYHDNSKLRASILTKLGLYFVGKGGDHL